MHKVFLYDNKLDLGLGQFASVNGFKLVSSGFNKCPEAIKDEDNKIYGYIHEISNQMLEILDTYYGLGVNLHNRIAVQAVLEGGIVVDVSMYEYNMELV
ncbi:MAG: gamma-glutamylcyclotransferase family protein [Candidatus Thorarchaeota archaeon]|jgi:gamma-glutamylcyclotransferase (GGCT)/AIG2-like uncharacterized protein YtfP